jgi:hypothetical protein
MGQTRRCPLAPFIFRRSAIVESFSQVPLSLRPGLLVEHVLRRLPIAGPRLEEFPAAVAVDARRRQRLRSLVWQ